MNYIGYSTGAVALHDFEEALELLSAYNFDAIELSALRIHEVANLIDALPRLDLTGYSYISFHAPSSFDAAAEPRLIEMLSELPDDWPIVLHPDAVHNIDLWRELSPRLAIENMDKRKGIGRSADELSDFFEMLPDARMCLDLGHARQVDSSMVGAYQFMRTFADRIVQLHISEVDVMNQHDIISRAAELAFLQVKQFIPPNAAIILESRVTASQIQMEANKVANILRVNSPANQIEAA